MRLSEGDSVYEFALFLVFPAAMAFACAMDLFTMTIPNRISFVLIVGFILAAPLSSLDAMGIASHVGAGLVVLVAGILMFSRGWFGGGDAKLMAAVALWFGFERLLEYLVCASIAGGVLAFLILLYRRFAPPLWLVNQDWAMRLHHHRGGIPYGIALGVGGLWVYPSTMWFSNFAV